MDVHDIDTAPRTWGKQQITAVDIGGIDPAQEPAVTALGADLAAQAFFGLEQAATQVELFVADPDQVAPVTEAADLRAALDG